MNDLLAEEGRVTLSPGVRQALSERVATVKDNGHVAERKQYMQLKRKLRAVYRAAGDAFGDHLAVSYDDEGWASFGRALEVRDRITHPKTFAECHVGHNALDLVDQGRAWFRGVANEFVRVARQHREAHRW